MPVRTVHVSAVKRARERGFTLIEILVAVVVLSLGLLGVAGLQITSKRANFEGMQRSQATMVANDVLERIRAMSDRVTATDPASLGAVQAALGAYAATPIKAVTAAGAAPAQCAASDAAALCATKTAAYDRWAWHDALFRSDSLITPQLCVTTTGNLAVGSVAVRVVVAWHGIGDSARAGAADPCGAADIDNLALRQLVLTTALARR